MNIVSRIVYLLGYEFLFRGILLFPLAGAFGVWPAVAINIAFFTHVALALTNSFTAMKYHPNMQFIK